MVTKCRPSGPPEPAPPRETFTHAPRTTSRDISPFFFFFFFYYPPAAPELKFTPLDLKAVADDGVFEGYASLFNREDMGGDMVFPGAFRDSLARRGPTGIKLLFQHNPGEPIGIWHTLRRTRAASTCAAA